MRFRTKLGTWMCLVAGLALTLGAFTVVYREQARVRTIAQQSQTNLFIARDRERALAISSAVSATQLRLLAEENVALKARVVELERKLRINAPPPGGGSPPSPSR